MPCRTQRNGPPGACCRACKILAGNCYRGIPQVIGMKVLVTGATGFVGRALLAEFEARGIETISVGGPKSVDVAYSVDVGDGGALGRLDGETAADAVVHAAGIA